LVVEGTLHPGSRLPNEEVLAREYGVSRATLREALRSLAAEDLIRTAKGARGGTYVRLPRPERVAGFLHSSITLMADADDVTLDELLEARALLEVPAARLAALRRSDDELVRLREAIPARPLRLRVDEQFAYNQGFHTVLLTACGNTLLSIAAQPVFGVLQRNLARARLGVRFHRTINDQHRTIAAAIEARDDRLAEDEMHAHLEFLRPYYERAWRASR
jgi:DNA-binding FadR family transcriptional regulator